MPIQNRSFSAAKQAVHGLPADGCNPPVTIDLKSDGHVHTRFCNHASGEMEDYVRAALTKGLESITFLEHLEAEIRYPERTWLTDTDFDSFFQEGNRLREKYQGALTINLGVETGFNPSAVARLREMLARYPWDRVGLSYHFFSNGNQHFNMVSRRPENMTGLAALGLDRVLSGYFAGLIQAVRDIDGQVLCHVDAVMRHYPHLSFNRSHWQQVEQLLDLVAQKNMGLELNTSGFAIRGEPYPCQRIVAMAIRRNIPLIPGSDAHRPDQVGRYFDRLPEFLAPGSPAQ